MPPAGPMEQHRPVPKTYAFDPDWVIKPGDTLQEMLDESGMPGDTGYRMVSKLSGIPVPIIEKIISGEQEINDNIAECLAAGVSPLLISKQFWLNLERAYREGLKAGKKEL